MACKKNMHFKPMSSICKKVTRESEKCSDWVATEKVHGSSFQFYTNDGVLLNVGSRRRCLDGDGSFVRCNVKEVMKEYQDYALKLWHIVHSEDQWTAHRVAPRFEEVLDDDDDDIGDEIKEEGEGEEETAVGDSEDKNEDDGQNNPVGGNGDGENDDKDTSDVCQVRIYGELYGGGGVDKDVKSAVQKEIIYCDEFRFYVFGVTINYRWVTNAELNDLCERAGFPYYARPLCSPMASPEDVIQWLNDTDLIRSRSDLTEKKGDEKTSMEGVVITPLVRPNFRLNAIKYLFPAFSDVRATKFGKTQTTTFCTKQRYHSVISKLDIPERENYEMVVEMFTQDVIKESPNKNPCDKLKQIWRGLVLKWLEEDGYVDGEVVVAMAEEQTVSGKKGNKKDKKNKRDGRGEDMRNLRREKNKKEEEKKKEEEEEEEDGDMGLGLFDS